jgi:uncharacterized protein YyaL (SSP411 family)
VRLVVALLALLGALVAASAAPAEHDRDRAALAHRAMRRAFFDTGTGLYREVEGRRTPASAWPYSQALAATIALSNVPRVGARYLPFARRQVAALARYARADGAYTALVGGASDVYFDDNEWIALDLLAWHDRTGDARSLAVAQQLFRLVTAAWDEDVTHPCAGGVFWTTAAANRDRNTVTTATGALVALRLAQATGDHSYVDWARRMLGWVEQCMAAPDGLFWDHIDLGGQVDQRHWSYNQGTAIGAYVLLYQLDGDAAALARAQDLAEKSLAFFDRHPRGSEPPFFLAIFFRNLLTLDRVAHRPQYRRAQQSYADRVWRELRDARSGLFAFRGDGPERLLEQAAVVQLYATLAEPGSTVAP